MGVGKDRGALIRCASCGRTDATTGADGQIFWLRQDAGLGLGVCNACSEWLDAWDRGERDVPLARDITNNGHSHDLTTLERMIQNAGLPSFSHVLLEVYDLLSSETAGVGQIARLLQTDAALTARTLKLANSAYYACSGTIATVDRALTRIGPFDLWWLLFTTEVKSLFYGIDQHLMDMEKFWRHSLMVACVSRCMAEQQRCGDPREMFVAGLLHDIGKLLLLQRIPIEYGALLERMEAGESLVDLERAELGFTHSDAGGALLDRWKLPAQLVARVRSHHQQSAELKPENLVAEANRLAHRMFDGDTERRGEADPQQAIIDASEILYRRLEELVL